MRKLSPLLVTGLLLATGCSAGTVLNPKSDDPLTQDKTYTFEWEKVSPQKAGFNKARLTQVIHEAKEQNSACFVVVRDGKLVVERYWRGETAESGRPVFSVTKSVTSTLVGIAHDDGDLTIDDRASDYIPSWRETPSENVTIRNLLANDSGREWSPTIDYKQLIDATNRTQFAIRLGQDAKPGTVWAYNNAAIQTLEPILREATGRRPYEMARDRLFIPLGMKHTRMTSDASAQSTGTAFGLISTCLDLARFGLLFEQQGVWDDKRLISKEWVQEATGESSQKLNVAYGFLWWLNRSGPIREPLDKGSSAPPRIRTQEQMAPGAPERMYSAVGFGGQYVLVDPDSRTVVVRLADPEVGGVPDSYEVADAARVVTHALN